MSDESSLLDTGAAVSMLGINAVENGAAATAAATGDVYRMIMGNPAETGQGLPLPANLTDEEFANLKTFDEADFEIFSNQRWERFKESHAPNVRVHWPDGHYTDGLEKHIEDMGQLFVWAPSLKVVSHPLRIAKNNLVAVPGTFTGTFSEPMPDGKGGFIPPTGKSFAMNMITVGVFNRQGTMNEEFLFWDQYSFSQQIGLA